MNFNGDARLPFFAYGTLMTGELAHFQIKDFVESVRVGSVSGELHERDGLVLLRPRETGPVQGQILTFKPEHEAAAYRRISGFEPSDFYKWDTLDANGHLVNVLVGRGERWNSEERVDLLGGSWEDPYFTVALDKVSALLATARESNGGPTPEGMSAQLDLQMAYQLLWTSIERYLSLRYGFTGSPGDVSRNLPRLAKEEGFIRALGDLAVRNHTVWRSDRRTESQTLDMSDAEAAVNYYYLIRSNATHRGKAAHTDFKILRDATSELLLLFRAALDFAKSESRLQVDQL